jgi:hypothetical protein
MGLLTLGFDPDRFQPKPPACYRASWQLPGPDSHRQATTSLSLDQVSITSNWLGARKAEARICAMARVTYESKDNAGHKFWVARYGRYTIRIDATRRGVYPWLITLEGRSVRKGVAPDRDEAADAVSDALDELSR